MEHRMPGVTRRVSYRPSILLRCDEAAAANSREFLRITFLEWSSRFEPAWRPPTKQGRERQEHGGDRKPGTQTGRRGPPRQGDRATPDKGGRTGARPGRGENAGPARASLTPSQHAGETGGRHEAGEEAEAELGERSAVEHMFVTRATITITITITAVDDLRSWEVDQLRRSVAMLPEGSRKGSQPGEGAGGCSGRAGGCWRSEKGGRGTEGRANGDNLRWTRWITVDRSRSASHQLDPDSVDVVARNRNVEYPRRTERKPVVVAS